MEMKLISVMGKVILKKTGELHFLKRGYGSRQIISMIIYSSFSFSVAKIPWLGKFFIGFIAFLYFNGRFHMFSTYNNSVISEIKHSPGTIDLILKNYSIRLEVRVLKSTFGELRAPVSGDMSRRIKESIDSEVTLSLFDSHNNLIYNDSSKRAGLECIDKIFEYFNDEK